MSKSGLIISTDLVLPDARQLVEFGGMSAGAAGILRKKPDGIATGANINTSTTDLPAEFAGATILGADGRPAGKAELSGTFVDATGGLVVATDDQIKALKTGAPVIVAKPGG